MSKTWYVVEAIPESYIVHLTFNDIQHGPGEAFYGPFTLEDAEDFAQNFDADDTEVEDARLIVLNLAIAKGSNQKVDEGIRAWFDHLSAKYEEE